MTRIVGGRWSGRRLVAPQGQATRPTAEKVRAAVANALQSGGALDAARVLDLYAGSGAVGLELASRGAERVVFVERSRPAQTAIRANIASFDNDGAALTLVPGDAESFAGLPGDPFDVIVADPPYAQSADDLGVVLARLAASGRIAPGADLVVERAARDGAFPWPNGLVADRSRRYGDTLVCYGHAL